MVNIELPTPHVVSDKPEDQIIELIDYLNQFVEALEFLLAEMNGSMVTTLPKIPEQTTVADVIGSYAFRQAVEKIIDEKGEE